MKSLTKFVLMIVAVMVAFPIFGQDTIPTVTLPATPADWFSEHTMEVVYGVLVVIGGYLSAFIPGLNKITVGVYRVLTWAVITGAAAIFFKGANVWGIAITYFVSTGLYSVLLRLIFASPKPKDANGNPISGSVKPLIS